jgi:hypothetical protein
MSWSFDLFFLLALPFVDVALHGAFIAFLEDLRLGPYGGLEFAHVRNHGMPLTVVDIVNHVVVVGVDLGPLARSATLDDLT